MRRSGLRPHSVFAVIGACIFTLTAVVYDVRAQTPNASPTEASLKIRERGADFQTWERVERSIRPDGAEVLTTNTYTELATGLHYRENGEWKDSHPIIEPTAGGAVGRFAGHSVFLAENLNTAGAISLVMPDGKQLRSHVLGLRYYDFASGDVVLIASIKDSEGSLVASNQVLYADAFEGVNADVRYTHRRNGFEQDVILRDTLPDPEQFGLNPDTTRLQVLTEFLDNPSPAQSTAEFDKGGLTDTRLNFGRMRIGRGKAFPIKPAGVRGKESEVRKSWENAESRNFLIEDVHYDEVVAGLKSRAGTAQAGPSSTAGLAFNARTYSNPFPSAPPSRKTDAPIQIASRAATDQGYVVDYQIVSGETDNFTFASNTTYQVTGSFWIWNSATFQGGTVIKYVDDASDFSGIFVDSATVVFNTTSALPAVFTSVDDNSVGATISGSTGNPARLQTTYLAKNDVTTIKYCTFSYAGEAVYEVVYSEECYPVENSQFLHCDRGITLPMGSLTISNVLFLDCGTAVACGGEQSFTGDPYLLTALNVIVKQGTNFFTAPEYSNALLDLSCCEFPGLQQNVTALGATINGSGGYYAWSQTCDFVDTDGDAMADSWELAHFGSLAQAAASDYDGDGLNNLTEFQYSTDPNSIQFTTTFSSLSVKTTQPSGNFVVRGGVPAWAAVLVNNTNLASATWVPYSSTFTATLGSTDGVYRVILGLKGQAADSRPTWSGVAITLDRAAPNLVLLSPTGTNISKPVIQIQGYSTDALYSVTYDLTNALGRQTNLPGFLTSSSYPSNALPTNFFQCFDVRLTNGNNTITLRVTDQAGNITTNVTSYQLSYAGDTTPPALGVIWPADGARLSGTSFTVRGTTEDANVQVSAKVIAGGVTNTVNGTVDRTGVFWAESLPLAAGNNTLRITATDSAGNVTTTNLTIVKSATTLTINSGATNDLKNYSVTVTGTLSVTNQKVWVNGVAATMDVAGNWTATNVPVVSGGMSVLAARAIPLTDHSGNGTAAAGNPDDPSTQNPSGSNDTDFTLVQVKPSALALSSGYWWSDFERLGLPLASGVSNISVQSWSWTNAVGGVASRVTTSGGTAVANSYVFRPDQTGYSFGPGGIVEGGGSYGFADGWSITLPKARGQLSWYNPTNGFSPYTSAAILAQNVKWVLRTGGPAGSVSWHTWYIQGAATEVLSDAAAVFTTGQAIPYANVSIAGVPGHLGTDGTITVVLPDNAEVDVTVLTGSPYYLFEVTATR